MYLHHAKLYSYASIIFVTAEAKQAVYYEYNLIQILLHYLYLQILYQLRMTEMSNVVPCEGYLNGKGILRSFKSLPWKIGDDRFCGDAELIWMEHIFCLCFNRSGNFKIPPLLIYSTNLTNVQITSSSYQIRYSVILTKFLEQSQRRNL